MATPRVVLWSGYEPEYVSYLHYPWGKLEAQNAQNWSDFQRRGIFWFRDLYFSEMGHFEQGPSVVRVKELEEELNSAVQLLKKLGERTHGLGTWSTLDGVEGKPFELIDWSTDQEHRTWPTIDGDVTFGTNFERLYKEMIKAAKEISLILNADPRREYPTTDVRKPERRALATCHEWARAKMDDGSFFASQWGFNPSPKSPAYRKFITSLFERQKPISETDISNLSNIDGPWRDIGPDKVAPVLQDIAKLE